ncbi:bifunctional protein Rib2p [Trichomonascus vanleenenianus]|uniref:bifunctional DRAP deaminase/tRNA pseudouridine synthase RIB2 n=1 Tax=Trichomonascus vanleenenianus TaxID=2268995 RepID=UPI003ECBA31A
MTSRNERKKENVKRDEAGFRVKRQHLDSEVQLSPDHITIKDEIAQGAEYVIEGPLRRVPPYYFTYITFCKQRWRDRKLMDIFTTEFRDKDEAYYRKAIAEGQVYVNDKKADLNTVLRNGEKMRHRTHKHEPPVTSREVKIVHEDDELVVIDKPSGMPVHPTGRYRFNTAVMILKHERGLHVHPCNRLDRLTSGLMFMAKNPKGAEKMGQQLRSREVRKEYIARVIGEFPAAEEIVCEEPLLTVDPKVALNRVHAEGKEAKTAFQRISYDGQTSVVKCKPFTGRTHQIRVHLQYLGYPIANDPIYSNVSVWGENLGKGGDGDTKEIAAKLDRIGKDKVAESWFFPVTQETTSHNHIDSGERLTGSKCDVCETDLYTDPGPNDLDLWLHAQRYYAEDMSWSYETPMPDWALESHRPFMQMALEEARKCGPTETAFSVGAVLVKDGEVLETGYSRELPGNTHAEQCALQKYFDRTGEKDVPPGTVIYTTMEPCSLRLSGNEPCVDRILKTSIKTVFVGVMEPDTFVKKNTGLDKLRHAGVEYIHIPGFEAEAIKAATFGHPSKESTEEPAQSEEPKESTESEEAKESTQSKE